VLPRKTIEQAAVPVTAVAMTIAGLLVKDLFHASSDAIGVLHNYIGELRRLERLRKLAFGRFIVKCRQRLFGTLRLVRSRVRCGNRYAESGAAQNRARKNSSLRSHHDTPQKRNDPLFAAIILSTVLRENEKLQ
jgi:hypothetical protein